MPSSPVHSFGSPLLATLRAAGFVDSERKETPPPPRTAFVTISRQAGAGGRALAAALVEALNRGVAEGGAGWRAWDHELVEKVAAEHGLPEPAVEGLEDAEHPWLAEVVGALSPTAHCEEFKVYRRVAATIRTLAARGRAVIVGRGGVFVTRPLTGGVHVQLVAPPEYRIARTADRLTVGVDEAAKRVAEIDRNRAAFYHRHWPGMKVSAETFTLTLNAAVLSADEMAACIVPLVRSIERPAERPAAAVAPQGRSC